MNYQKYNKKQLIELLCNRDDVISEKNRRIELLKSRLNAIELNGKKKMFEKYAKLSQRVRMAFLALGDYRETSRTLASALSISAIENPEDRLGGESVADLFRSVGGVIRESWCGPCFGQGPDALEPGQRAITTFNRNWQNRMGVGGEGYLAAPMVVAASALLGFMGPPSELGLDWSADEYGV